ncbi:unnamed protein product [Ixodes pacificus]
MISLSPVLRIMIVFQRISHKRTSEASRLPFREKNFSLPRERGTTKNTSFRVSCFAKSELRANACFSRPPREWRPENPWAPTFSTSGPVMRGQLPPSAARPAHFTRSGARDSLFCLAPEEGAARQRGRFVDTSNTTVSGQGPYLPSQNLADASVERAPQSSSDLSVAFLVLTPSKLSQLARAAIFATADHSLIT